MIWRSEAGLAMGRSSWVRQGTKRRRRADEHGSGSSKIKANAPLRSKPPAFGLHALIAFFDDYYGAAGWSVGSPWSQPSEVRNLSVSMSVAVKCGSRLKKP